MRSLIKGGCCEDIMFLHQVSVNGLEGPKWEESRCLFFIIGFYGGELFRTHMAALFFYCAKITLPYYIFNHVHVCNAGITLRFCKIG